MSTKSNFGKGLLVAVTLLLVISMIAVVPVQAGRVYGYGKVCINKGLIIIIVKNPDGTPATGAKVIIKDSSGTQIDEGTTGRFGRYVTCLPFGKGYIAEAIFDGLFGVKTFDVRSLLTRIELKLEPTCTEVTITVLNETDQPQYPAHVYVYDQTNTLVADGAVDTNGQFKICIKDGNYYAEAWRPDGKLATSDAFTVPGITKVVIHY